jgi:hypothetical protein
VTHETRGIAPNLIVFSVIVFACAISVAHLAAAQATCPPTIATEQKGLAPGPEWAVTYSGYQTAVAGVTIFDGPPAEQASLAPNKEKTRGTDVAQTWQLPKSDRGYWLQCNYANTTAQISRRLPADATQCVVVYDHNERLSGGAYVVKSVNCK